MIVLNHQIGEFQHSDAVISIFTRGIIISSEVCEQIFVGEEFLTNIDLLSSFLDLNKENLAIKFGGAVKGDEENGSDREFWIYHLFDDLYAISDDCDESDEVLKVHCSFLELLRSSAVYQMHDGQQEVDCEGLEEWIIYGSLPNTDIAFAINQLHFELSIKNDNGQVMFFYTDRKDRGLWFRSIVLAELMLERELSDGSWQIARADGTDKRVRLELEGNRVLFSLDDPSLPNVNVSIYLDREAMAEIKTILNSVWVVASDDFVDEDDEISITSDDEDDDEEEVM